MKQQIETNIVKQDKHYYQVGCISGMQEWFTIIWSINVNDDIKRLKEKNNIII